MEHREAREMLSARADGELEPSAVRALDDHLDACVECNAFGDGLLRLRALAVALPRVPEPDGLRARPPAVRVRARRASFRFAPALAAAVVVAVILTILFGCAIARYLIGAPMAPAPADEEDEPDDGPVTGAPASEKLVSPRA